MNFDTEIGEFENQAFRLSSQNDVRANNQAFGLKSVIKVVNVQFPNGFENWQETHFEIIHSILRLWEKKHPFFLEVMKKNGRGGFYTLAKQWTLEFENINKNKEWDGEWFDEIEIFINQKIN